MKKIHFFCFLSLFLFNSSYLPATTYFGYIVTLEGDTIEGKIPGTGWIAMQQAITFNAEAGGKRIYTPEMIRGYGIDRLGKYFRSVEAGGEIGRKFLLEVYADAKLVSCKYIYRTEDGRRRSAVVLLQGEQVIKINWTNPASLVDYASHTNIAEGGIIQPGGDTLKGWIKVRYTKDDKYLMFNSTLEGDFEKVKIDAIAGYYVEDKVFVKIRTGKKDKLAFLLVDGDLQLLVDYARMVNSVPLPGLGNSLTSVPLDRLEKDFYYYDKESEKVLSARKLSTWLKDYYPEADRLIRKLRGQSKDHIAIAEIINLSGSPE